MPNLELSFASGESSLSVRTFSIEQRLSGLFEIGVVAVSPDDDLDLDALLGSGAVLRLGATDAGATFRAWTGIVSHAEQVDIDAAYQATYFLRLVPTLWRATRRRNNRIFQHKSLPEIAVAVLAEWGIEPALELDVASFPRFEYRVQYAESDFAFLSRILEEAGITYAFRDPDADQPAAQTALVLASDPQRNEPRAAGPLLYVPGKDGQHPPSSLWHVRFADQVRSGKVTLRDYDFRSRPDFQLIAEARAHVAVEDRFELYDYVPGAFLVEPEGGRHARVDERHAQALAARHLHGERNGKRTVSFRTNALDLVPGTVVTITGHPRHELAEGRRLLVIHQNIAGARDGDWSISCHAVPADEPHRPMFLTPKPRIAGVQSALVVGPPGEEIHTDEFGRVRVQFHWDREGKRDQHTSCFVRVSQAWAGHGFGMQALPRVGDEVIVHFFEGDPDQPVIVGRVHNSAAIVPLALPAQKTRTTWRSESTPGGGGWNEITFEDQKGKELVYMQAERDLERLVKHDESVTIGASLTTKIGDSETREIAADQSVVVAGSQSLSVKGSQTIAVGESFKLDLGGGAAGIVVSSDKRIVLSTGEASIVLDGPNIFFDGQAAVQLSAGEVVAIGGSEVHVDGGPNVFLNAGSAPAPGPVSFAGEKAADVVVDVAEEQVEQKLQALVSKPVEAPGAAPEAVAVPAHVEDQLKAAREKIMHGVEELEAKVQSKVEMAKAKLKKLGENIVPLVEKARAEINARIEQLRGLAEKIKAEAAARIEALKAEIHKIEAEVRARVDKAKELVERAKKEIELVKERIEEVKGQVRKLVADVKQRITDLKNNVKQRFDDLRKRAIEVRNEAQHVIDEVKGAIEHAKEQAKQLVTDVKTGIEHAKQHIKNIVDDLKNGNMSLKDRLKAAFGEMKSLSSDAKADAAKVSGDAKAIVNDAKANAAQIEADVKKTVADGKALGQEAVKDAKDTVADAKKAAKDTVDEAKAVAADAKKQAQDTASEVKSIAADAKQQAKDAAGEAKEIAGDLKQQAKDTATQAKDLAGEAKQQAQGAAQDAKGLYGDAKNTAAGLFGKGSDTGSAPVAFAYKGSIPSGSGAGSNLPSLDGLTHAPPPAAPASSIVTRSGGFGAGSVARAVNGTDGATFLQSPNEGQLMILRTQAARPIAPETLSAHVVEHQMNGMPSSDAFAAVLKEHGYAVYERPWDATYGEFLQKAVL